MIEKISLHNFKCYTDQDFDLAELTLLSGVNGIGKSSLIQAILSIQQTFRGNNPVEDIIINGNLVHLGLPEDIISDSAQDDLVSITLTLDGHKTHYNMRFDKQKLSLVDGAPQGITSINRFTYLCAERIGPRASFPVPTPEEHASNKLGKAGQFAAYELDRLGMNSVTCSGLLLSSDTLSPNMLTQTEAWLGRISRPLRVHTKIHSSMDVVNLEFSFFTENMPTRAFRSSNVGFGLTYALPIFVAVLSAQPGDCLIIENPEAHLHPKGQVIMGEFLALAAAEGIQVIIETHSDHLLNGVRVAVKKSRLPPQRTKIHFFGITDKGKPQVTTPQMDANGRFDIWPEDFFDEWDKQLLELL